MNSTDTTNDLAEHFRFFQRHKLVNAAKSTAYQYELNMQRFAEFLGRPPVLADLQDDTVAAAAQWLMKSKGLSAASASKMRDNIVAFWKFLARKTIVNHWPDVPDIATPRRIPKAWTREQLVTLWEYLRRMPGDLGGVPACDWMCSLHAVLWDTGERIGAALQAEWTQVDLESGYIIMRAETRKGRMSDKLSRLHPATVAMLVKIQEPARRKVWPWPYDYTYIWKLYGEILRRAGLPNDRQSKFHRLRKSVASHITALGGDAQSAMGHASRTITESVYIDPRISQPKGPSDILFRPWESGEGGGKPAA